LPPLASPVFIALALSPFAVSPGRAQGDRSMRNHGEASAGSRASNGRGVHRILLFCFQFPTTLACEPVTRRDAVLEPAVAAQGPAGPARRARRRIQPEEVKSMSNSIVAVYESEGQVKNAIDDLIATGIPQDEIRSDHDQHRISVVAADTARPEIVEILKRHQPTEISD
jgi:hypothetical protein